MFQDSTPSKRRSPSPESLPPVVKPVIIVDVEPHQQPARRQDVFASKDMKMKRQFLNVARAIENPGGVNEDMKMLDNFLGDRSRREADEETEEELEKSDASAKEKREESNDEDEQCGKDGTCEKFVPEEPIPTAATAQASADKGRRVLTTVLRPTENVKAAEKEKAISGRSLRDEPFREDREEPLDLMALQEKLAARHRYLYFGKGDGFVENQNFRGNNGPWTGRKGLARVPPGLEAEKRGKGLDRIPPPFFVPKLSSPLKARVEGLKSVPHKETQNEQTGLSSVPAKNAEGKMQEKNDAGLKSIPEKKVASPSFDVEGAVEKLLAKHAQISKNGRTGLSSVPKKAVHENDNSGLKSIPEKKLDSPSFDVEGAVEKLLAKHAQISKNGRTGLLFVPEKAVEEKDDLGLKSIPEKKVDSAGFAVKETIERLLQAPERTPPKTANSNEGLKSIPEKQARKGGLPLNVAVDRLLAKHAENQHLTGRELSPLEFHDFGQGPPFLPDAHLFPAPDPRELTQEIRLHPQVSLPLSNKLIKISTVVGKGNFRLIMNGISCDCILQFSCCCCIVIRKDQKDLERMPNREKMRVKVQ